MRAIARGGGFGTGAAAQGEFLILQLAPEGLTARVHAQILLEG